MPFVFAVLLFVSFLFAEDEYVFDPFAERMGAGSREIAKGGTGVADTSAFFAAYWNPGMLAFKRHIGAALHAEHSSQSRSGGSFGIEGGAGNRMGVGMVFILRGDEDIFWEDQDRNPIGHATPLFIFGYTGLGYRISKKDGFGVSLSMIYDRLDYNKDIGFVSEFQSPLSFDLGWFRFWNEKWQSGLQIRNLGFNSKLSASWRRNLSREGDGVYALRPKTFEAGLTHRNLLLGKPASVSLSLLSYQEADTLFVFDPDLHSFKSKFGFEWRVINNGDLRFGIDHKKPSIGCGYALDAGSNVIFIDYAWPLSLTLRMKF